MALVAKGALASPSMSSCVTDWGRTGAWPWWGMKGPARLHVRQVPMTTLLCLREGGAREEATDELAKVVAPLASGRVTLEVVWLMDGGGKGCCCCCSCSC